MTVGKTDADVKGLRYIITSVSKFDADIYICRAENKKGIVYKQINLKVNESSISGSGKWMLVFIIYFFDWLVIYSSLHHIRLEGCSRVNMFFCFLEKIFLFSRVFLGILFRLIGGLSCSLFPDDPLFPFNFSHATIFCSRDIFCMFPCSLGIPKTTLNSYTRLSRVA